MIAGSADRCKPLEAVSGNVSSQIPWSRTRGKHQALNKTVHGLQRISSALLKMQLRYSCQTSSSSIRREGEEVDCIDISCFSLSLTHIRR